MLKKSTGSIADKIILGFMNFEIYNFSAPEFLDFIKRRLNFGNSSIGNQKDKAERKTETSKPAYQEFG
jgi:hypothetical protein